MNDDFRARLLQKAKEIKAQRDAAETEIITLQDLKQKAEQAKAEAEANTALCIDKLNTIRDAVKSIGLIPTLSELRNLLSAIRNIVDT